MLGISTCWWSNPSLSGDGIVADILELGFRGVELEYRITSSQYHEMKPLLKKDITVLSIHNFFPKPDDPRIKKGGGDLFLLSSTDRDERSKALEFTIRTIEHANDLEARAVVLHLGRVDMPNPIERFRELFESSKTKNAEGLEFIEEQRDLRKSNKRKNLDAVLFSLDRLNREAEKHGVFLGIENRYYFHEIPNFEEIGIILREFEGGRLRYWHDVGHARALENLGVCTQRDILETYSNGMIGTHLHDIKGLDDHFAPGQGEIDFEEIKPFIKPDMIKIIEVHPKVDRDQLMQVQKEIM
ncbi:MAG: TIM barrel protein [Thermodesulfobacteriota bacterium]|nr:TIM barrel protein [Thermodesulfobacteriota bacterium]